MPGQSISVEENVGLDLRRVSTRADQKSLLIGINVEVTPGKGIKSRPGTRKVAKADPATKGLFSANGVLYAVAPSGYPNLATSQSPILRYAFIGDGAGYDIDHIGELSGAETIGQSPTGKGLPYLSITTKTGQVEHHYLKVEPTTPGEIINTLVDLPFKPSPGLLKLDSRLWCPSDFEGTMRFNSIIQGPDNWTEPGDAGYIPVARNAPGDRTIRGVTYFRNYLVVAFDDSMQLWATDENPDNITLVEVLNGPGTIHPKALENVLGDTFYLSRGGFRSIATATVEGEQREQDIGARVNTLTATLPVSPAPVALWSQFRGQYLCAFGSTIMVFTYIPSEKTYGWAQWDMPFSVTDMVEKSGRLFVRDTENYVHEFDDEIEEDDGVPFVWRAKTQFLGRDSKARLWNFIDLSLGMVGEASVYAYPMPDFPDEGVLLGIFSGTTSPYDRIGLNFASNALAIEFRGSKRWQLDAYSIRLDKQAV